MQQRMFDLQLIPQHSNLPAFKRTLPFALLACGAALCAALRSLRSHWANHGAAKTAAAGLLAYAGWKSFRFVRKQRSPPEFLERLEPLLTLSGVRSAIFNPCDL